jgi:DNA-binding SARP family transcriptional activator
MRAIHLAVAQRAEAFDWRIGTHHYRAAGRDDDARRVLTDSIETILGTGAYAAAEEVAASLESHQADPAVLILRSRGAQQRGLLEAGVDLAEEAFAADPRSPAAILNLMTARTLQGNVEGALEVGALLENSPATRLSKIGPAFRSMIATSTDGSLVVAGADLEALVGTLREQGEHHFLGVALSNWSYLLAAQGEPHLAYLRADEAVELLRASSAGVELVSALLARAGASAHLGSLESARNDIEESRKLGPLSSLTEVAYEGAQLETYFGSSERALALIALVEHEVSPLTDRGEQALLAAANLMIRRGEYDAAARQLQQLQFGERRSAIAFDVRRRAAAAALAFLNGDEEASSKIRRGITAAAAQGAKLWARYLQLLLHLIESPGAEDARRLADDDPALLSMAAEPLVRRLHELSPATVEAITAEASRRPERWREPLRQLSSSSSGVGAFRAAVILEQIGELSDVPLLRATGRRLRANPGAYDLGRVLARRLAPRVVVEDLGRVRLRIGMRLVEGSAIRRRVLELLCFLLTRPKFASTREEALEALWPDLDPSSGLNSLNQTVYFLRRVFEPNYNEDLSPGYVGQDSEMVWLDTDLVDSRSRRCREMIRSAETRGGDGILALAREYRARFALDFAYDDWSTSFRDSLHASFLRVVEQAIHVDIELGHLVHAIELAELALEVEPDAEELELSLLRLYRMTGAHAAAAERYAHYAMTLRGLGIEPPRLADV